MHTNRSQPLEKTFQAPGPHNSPGSLRRLWSEKALRWLPLAAVLVGVPVLAWWLWRSPNVPLALRIPGTDRAASADAAGSTNAVLIGKLIPGTGAPADLRDTWSGFRGTGRDGISRSASALARTWGPSGPAVQWDVEVGEGYAGAVIANGRVYIMDYDRDKKQDALRCLSPTDGQEIWRYTYPVTIKRNHGMSRTVPAVTDKFVVAIGPKCHVVCLDALTGQLRWGLDMVHEFGATVPPWYAGQCPLIDQDRVILAPGGKDALLAALDLPSGRVLWQTPNPKGWKMTHSSVMPMDLAGQRQYVYCATLGVVGVSATDGSLLWESTDWKISIATVPSPLVLDEGRLFLSGGYNAGSLLLQLTRQDGRLLPKTICKLDAETFGATQHTPVYYDKYLYGVRADGQFVCLSADGKVAWTSGPTHQFGLGSFLLADGLIFALNDSGNLSLIEATPARFQLLAQAQILKGHESWAPMALADRRLLARDLTRLVCLDVSGH